MYKFNLNSTSITRISDNACIPTDPANSDYARYLEWVALGNTTTPAETPAETLVRVKSVKIASLSKSYDTDISSPVAYMATTFDGDAYSRNLITNCLSAGSVPAGFYWVSAANVKVTMTFAELQGLANALLVRGQTSFTKLFDKKVTVNGATTPAAVDVVVW